MRFTRPLTNKVQYCWWCLVLLLLLLVSYVGLCMFQRAFVTLSSISCSVLFVYLCFPSRRFHSTFIEPCDKQQRARFIPLWPKVFGNLTRGGLPGHHQSIRNWSKKIHVLQLLSWIILAPINIVFEYYYPHSTHITSRQGVSTESFQLYDSFGGALLRLDWWICIQLHIG